MTCEHCGAKTGWVDGKKLERAHESKREAMKRAKEAMAFVEHTAKCSCNCQQSGIDVDENRHVKSCMVGKAQQMLGQQVTEKPLYGGV